jgi:formate hydrogenlyase subunit 4
MIQMLPQLFSGLLQIGLFASLSPAVIGTLWWLKARLLLRKGPPPWQLYLNLVKLFRTPSGQAPETTSWVYVVAPLITFVCYTLLAWATPPFNLGFIPLELVTVVYLLGFARFALALAGMDTGTPFGGMGSSREMFINVLAEPMLILVILALTLQRHTTDLTSILNGFSLNSSFFSLSALLLLWLALAFVAIMDNGLLPFDNPSTHLELTMIQKALHLEYSGRNLALIEWGEAMRLTFFLTLLSNLLVARNLSFLSTVPGILSGPLLYVVKLLIGIALLALFEITQIKLRLRRIVIPWIATLLLALAAIFLVIIG